MRADDLEEEVAATRLRLLQQKALASLPVFTVQSAFVMHWQLFMSVVLVFCTGFIPYDAGFLVPKYGKTLRLQASACRHTRSKPFPTLLEPHSQPSNPRRRAQRHPKLTHRPGVARLQLDYWSRTIDVHH